MPEKRIGRLPEEQKEKEKEDTPDFIKDRISKIQDKEQRREQALEKGIDPSEVGAETPENNNTSNNGITDQDIQELREEGENTSPEQKENKSDVVREAEKEAGVNEAVRVETDRFGNPVNAETVDFRNLKNNDPDNRREVPNVNPEASQQIKEKQRTAQRQAGRLAENQRIKNLNKAQLRFTENRLNRLEDQEGDQQILVGNETTTVSERRNELRRKKNTIEQSLEQADRFEQDGSQIFQNTRQEIENVREQEETVTQEDVNQLKPSGDAILAQLNNDLPENQDVVRNMVERRDRNPLLGASDPTFNQALKARETNLRVLNDIDEALENVRGLDDGQIVSIRTDGEVETVSANEAEESLEKRRQEVKQTLENNQEIVRTTGSTVERNNVAEGAASQFFNPNQEVSNLRDFSEEAEQAGVNLVRQGQEIGSETAEVLQSNPVTEDLGQGIAGFVESTEKFGEGLYTFIQGEPVKGISRAGQAASDFAVSQTNIEKFTPLSESEGLQEETTFVQSTAAGTPADTAGFFTAVGGGTASILEAEAKDLTGQRQGTDGEGFERISEGSAVLASQVARDPQEVIKEETIQEGTEAVLSLGLNPVTPTVTASTPSLKNTVSSIKTKTDNAVETITDTNALGSGAGAFLPAEKTGPETNVGPGTSPGPKTDVGTQSDFGDLDTETILQPDTQTSTNTQTETMTAPGTQTITSPTVQSPANTQTAAQAQTEALENSLTSSNAFTDTITETKTSTEAISAAETITFTPSNTPTPTPTPTNTFTPSPTPEPENDQNNLFSERNSRSGQEQKFAPDLGSILSGNTITEEQAEEKGIFDQTFTGLESRPEIIDTENF